MPRLLSFEEKQNNDKLASAVVNLGHNETVNLGSLRPFVRQSTFPEFMHCKLAGKLDFVSICLPLRPNPPRIRRKRHVFLSQLNECVLRATFPVSGQTRP